MVKPLPNKWIRKAIFDAVNNIVVDGVIIPCYDTMVTISGIEDYPEHYILMAAQSNEVDKANKCEYFWDSNILLDIVTTYDLPGNPGSRLLADNILEEVKDLTNNLTLDVASGLFIINQRDSFPDSLALSTTKENIFRTFLRMELSIR